MKQPEVKDHETLAHYHAVYPMLNECANGLIDISREINPIIAVDCCGWHYENIFSKKIIMLETLFTAKNYQLNQQQFTKLIDNRGDLVWPPLPDVIDPVILLDRSPLLKYHSMPKLQSVILDIISAYRPIKLLIRGNLQFIDDSRLRDRIQSWNEFFPVPGYITNKFSYDTELMQYFIDLKKCQ